MGTTQGLRFAGQATTITALLTMASLGAIFLYAPIESSQGIVQKIFYIHLSFVLPMYLFAFVGMLFAVVYLSNRQAWADALSAASIEVAFVCTTCVLLSGSIWAKPVWGDYWTWDPRLTSTLLIWLLYAAYLVIRGSMARSPRGRMWAAIFAIFAFLDVPLIHYSIRFFRGVHPRVISQGGVDSQMLAVVALSIVAFTSLMGLLTYLRYHVEMIDNFAADEQRRQLAEIR